MERRKFQKLDRKNMVTMFIKPGPVYLRYKVIYGSTQELPRCSCPDWKRNYLPCKHILAVLKYMENKSLVPLGKKLLESLSHTIQLEPILVEDGVTEDDDPIVRYPNASDLLVPDSTTPTEESNVLPAIEEQQTKPLKSNTGQKCREIMKEIVNLTHLMEHNEEALLILKGQLIKSLENMSTKAPRDFGLVLDKRVKKLPNKVQTKQPFQNIPKPKKKSSTVGRVGVASEMDIPDIKEEPTKRSQKIQLTTEECIPLDDKAEYDIPLPEPGKADEDENKADEDESEADEDESYRN
uniref:SWIM-type domain-containing protein n=1 Tax=Clytia hemisphaerica TaxID=252671 RepID=A0A7M5U3X9_9CNID